MANEVPIKLAFQGDMSAVKRELKDLKTTLDSIVVNTNNLNAFGQVDQQITKTINLAAQLQGQLQAATTKSGNLKLDVLAKEFDKSGTSLETYITQLRHLADRGYPEAARAADQLLNQIQSAYAPINQLSGTLSRVFNNLAQDIIKTFNYSLINKFTGAIRGAFYYAQNLDRSLNDIRIVTNLNVDQMAEFAKQANKAAMALGSTTLEYTKGALIYYQQGLSGNDVIERTNATIKLANTSGEAAEQISSYMTGIWNNFDKGSKSVEYYADVISYLGAVTAASNADIAEGVQAFAATASTVGLSFEYATSALTTLVDKTQQSASTIGNALKTIFARLSSVSLGETLEDGVNLSKYTKALATVGVDVLDANGSLKEMDAILDELGKRWQYLSNTEKTALAQTVGGVRQYNNLISLMDNYGYFKELVNEAYDSEGYLSKQNAIYLESWAAASDQVKTAWQKIYDLLIDDQLIIKLTKGFASIVSGVGDLINNLGGLKTLLPSIISLMMAFAGDRITQGIVNVTTSLRDFLTFNTANGGAGKARALQEKAATMAFAVDTSSNKQLESLIVRQNAMSHEFVKNRQAMTQAERVMREEQLKRNKVLIEQLVLEQKQIDKQRELLSNQYSSEVDKQVNRMDEATRNQVIEQSLYDVDYSRKDAKNYIDIIRDKLQTSAITRESDIGQALLKDFFKTDQKTGEITAKSNVSGKAIREAIEAQYNSRNGDGGALKDNLINDLLKQEGFTNKDEFDKQRTTNKDRITQLTQEQNALTAELNGESLEAEKKEELKQKIHELTEELKIETDYKTHLDEVNKRVVTGVEEHEQAVKELTEAELRQEQEQKQALEVAEYEAKQRAGLAYNLSSIAQAGTAVISIINSVSSAVKTLNDENVPLIQKLTTVGGLITTLTFQIGSLGNSLKKIATSGFLGQNVMKEMTEGSGKLVTALKAGGKEMALILAKYALIIAAIVAVIAVAKYLWNEYNRDSIAAKNAAKAADEAAAAFDNAKEKYNGLKEGIESYEDAQKAIEDLTVGTEEWSTAIEEANEQILDLLDSYPELAKYLHSQIIDGKEVLTLEEDGYKLALEQAKLRKQNAQIAKYSAAIGANAAENTSEITDFIRSHAYTTQKEVQIASTSPTPGGQATQVTQVQTSYEHFDTDTINKVLDSINQFGGDITFTTDQLEKLGITNTDLQNAIIKNKGALEQLNGTLKNNNSKNDALAKAMLNSAILNGDDSEAAKNAYTKFAEERYKEVVDLDEKGTELYNNKWADGKGKTDAQIQEEYAKAMGYVKYTDKWGNKGEYVDENGEVHTIDDEVARRYLAMQDAVTDFKTEIDNELKAFTSGQGEKGAEAVTAFIGGQQAGINNMYLSSADLDALKLDADNISITDEQAQHAGYDSAEKFIDAYKTALENYSQSGISADFDYGTEDFSKDDLEFLEEYTKRLMKLNEKSREKYDSDQEFESAMRDMAVRMINMNDALEDLNKNIDDYRTKIIKGEKGTEEYERALAAVRKDMSKLLDMDPDAFSEEFLKSKKNLNDMEKAANGDVEAFTRLQEAAAIDIVTKTEIKTDGAEDALKKWIGESEQFHVLEVGATLDTTEAGQKLAELFTQMLATGEMTAEEVNAALSAIGFEPNVKYVEMPLSEVDTSTQTAYTTDSEGNMVAVTDEMKLSKDSLVKVPVLNAKEIHYTKPNDTIKSQKPKGGGGGKKEKKDKKSGETEKKRYEVINNKLEETSELLTEIAGQKDRAFGADKIEKMEQEMDALNTQLDQYNTKLAEAKDWLEKDKKAMDAYGAKYDENGVIVNYDQIMDKQIAIYNAAVDRYNKSAQSDADKERFEAAEKAYEKFLKAYEQYNETLDLVGELEQNVLDTIYKIQDEMLEIIDTKVQLNVEVNDRDIELIEYLMKQLEDKAYSAADAIALLGKEAANSLDKIAGYQEGIADVLSDVNVAYDEQLQKRLQNGEIDAEEYNRLRQIGDAYAQQFLNGEISAEQYAELVHMDEAHIEKLKEYADAIKDETLKLQELRKEAYEKLGETIDQFNDDLDKQKDKIEKATSALENYRNIVDTFGKKNLGLDDDIFEQMSRAELKAAQSTAAISKMAVDEAKRAMEELQKQVDAATSEEQKRLLQEQLDKATEAYQDALDDWTSDLADAAEKVRDVFDDAIDAIVEKFDESVGGLFNNLGDLQEAFDQASTLDDQYVDDYKRVYELNKLNKKIHDSIDNGVTVKSRQLLLSLQDEINKKEAEGVELSEYDLEVYQKRYELYLAQIALEEAQNAKSTVRMSRDNEGNWSYVYVADQAAMDKALDDYNDKLQQYADLNENYIKNTQDTILSLEKEYQDALAGLDPTDPDYERKLAELQKYYNDRMAFYIQQLNNAFEANKEVAGYEEAEDWNVKQGFEDTLLGQLTGIASADEYAAIFGEAIDNATKAAEEKYQQYLDDLETTTADIQEIGETIGQAIADVETASDEAQANAGIIAETFKTAFEAALGELDAFTESYNADIDSMSFATARLLALINQLNEIKSGQTSNTDMPLPDTAYSDAALREVLGDELYDSITNKGTYDNIYGLANRNDTQAQLLEMEREYKITLNDNMETLGESINRMAEISAAGFGDLTSFLVDHTGKLEQQVTITANFPNAVNHAEIEEAFSNLVNMAAQFANRKN